MDMYVMIVAVVALIVTFGMPILIVAIISVYKMRKQRLIHTTILSLAEKGVAIPPELIVPPQRVKWHTANSDLKTGILLLSAGAGICLFFYETQTHALSLGAIPILMGIGYIVAWKIEKPTQSGS
jgi:Domain of unknown function (DUF6249)